MVFKTIENLTLIVELVTDRNSHHLNQARGSYFTVEPLKLCIRTYRHTPVVEAILNGKVNLQKLPLAKVTTRYLESLIRNNEILAYNNQRIIPFEDYKGGFRNWKEKTTTSPPGRHLNHHHSLLTPDSVQYSTD